MPSSPAPSTTDLQDVPLSSLLACHECDLLLRHVDLPLEHKACCPRCGYELQTHRAHMSRRALALTRAIAVNTVATVGRSADIVKGAELERQARADMQDDGLIPTLRAVK